MVKEGGERGGGVRDGGRDGGKGDKKRGEGWREGLVAICHALSSGHSCCILFVWACCGALILCPHCRVIVPYCRCVVIMWLGVVIK